MARRQPEPVDPDDAPPVRRGASPWPLWWTVFSAVLAALLVAALVLNIAIQFYVPTVNVRQLR
jgi:hypothetical protein